MVKDFNTGMEKKGSVDNSATTVGTGTPTQPAEGSALTVSNAKEYLKSAFYHDVEQYSARRKVLSGFPSLDAQTGPGLYPGLYVLGAGSSMGKTTFSLQMADQIAQAGDHVVYFTVEQSRFELVSKSLARTMYMMECPSPLTALEIRELGKDVSKIEDADAEYSSYCERITIVECGFNTTVEDIISYIEWYIRTYKHIPVVYVDYLQRIKSSDRANSTKKESMDMIMEKLKGLQLRHKLVMIVISSINRSNYMSEIDFASLKESGDIEYGADVVWGLQFRVLSEEEDFSTGGPAKINKKRKILREAKLEDPRRIDLICLKNRSAVPVYTCSFEYYAAFDCFKDVIKGVDKYHLGKLEEIKTKREGGKIYTNEDIYLQMELSFQ